jgi:hypothetical protein
VILEGNAILVDGYPPDQFVGTHKQMARSLPGVNCGGIVFLGGMMYEAGSHKK